MATEKKNKEKLFEMCHDRKGIERKSKSISNMIKSDDYIRGPQYDILWKSRIRSRIQMMSIFGMLDCANNYNYDYKGNLCSVCNAYRIHFCDKFKEKNLCNSLVKFDFRCINSPNQETVDR